MARIFAVILTLSSPPLFPDRRLRVGDPKEIIPTWSAWIAELEMVFTIARTMVGSYRASLTAQLLAEIPSNTKYSTMAIVFRTAGVGRSVGEGEVGVRVGAYNEGAAQEGAALRVVGQVISHCWTKALMKLFRLILQYAREVLVLLPLLLLGEQVLYEASNLQEVQDSQTEAPGPLNAPLSHAVQVLVPPRLKVPLGHSWQG